MPKPIPSFPHIATDAQFGLAFDRYSTTASAPIGINDTTITVANPLKTPTYAVLTIGTEKLLVTAGGSNPVSVTRGFDDTTPAAYGSLSTVAVNVNAYSHNSLVAEIEQIEKGLIPSASQYNFTPIQPSGSLTAGISNTVTLPNVPLGVNGTDTDHYLYISGGTGTAEAVLITGGTATAGGTSLTITFTPANNHSGAWTISSATGGMQEAIQDNSSSVLTLLDDVTCYAPTTILNQLVLDGNGYTVTWDGAASLNVFTVKSSNVTIRNFVIAADDAGSAIKNSGTRSDIRVINNIITGSANAVYFTAGTYLYFLNNTVSGFTDGGIVCSTSVNINYVIISGNNVDMTDASTALSAGIACWGSYSAIYGNTVKMGGTQDGSQGILLINSVGAGLTCGLICNNAIQLTGGSILESIGLGSVSDFVVSGNTVKVSGTMTRVGFYGIEINQCAKGTVSSNTITMNETGTQHGGIVLFSSSWVNVTNNTISGWGTDSFSAGIILTHTDTANPISGQMSFNKIEGNILRNTSASATNYNIYFATLTTGNAINNVIRGNTVIGNTTSGCVGIKTTNAGAATVTGMLIAQNTIITCDIGVEIAGTSTYLNGNKYTGCTARYSDQGTGSVIEDIQSVIPPTVASGTSIAADENFKIFKLSGTTTITTITGGIAGRSIRLIKTDAGSLTVGGGGNIPGSHTMAQYAGLTLTYDGSNWY